MESPKLSLSRPCCEKFVACRRTRSSQYCLLLAHMTPLLAADIGSFAWLVWFQNLPIQRKSLGCHFVAHRVLGTLMNHSGSNNRVMSRASCIRTHSRDFFTMSLKDVGICLCKSEMLNFCEGVCCISESRYLVDSTDINIRTQKASTRDFLG